jgi:hypothetical protein
LAGASSIGIAMQSGVSCTASALVSNLRQYDLVVPMKVGIMPSACV